MVADATFLWSRTCDDTRKFTAERDVTTLRLMTRTEFSNSKFALVIHAPRLIIAREHRSSGGICRPYFFRIRSLSLIPRDFYGQRRDDGMILARCSRRLRETGLRTERRLWERVVLYYSTANGRRQRLYRWTEEGETEAVSVCTRYV